jgi:Uma2 family endonuclease
MISKRLTVHEYHRMIDAGVLAREGRRELLDGFVVARTPHSPSEALTVHLALRQITKLLPPQWFCRVQSAITLAASEPEPDLAIVMSPERRYATRHPAPSDIALVIEVAESSLTDDRSEKGMLYAQAAIPQFWIVNLIDRCIEVYTDSSGPSENPDYRQKREFDSNSILPLILGSHDCGSIAVPDLLP